MDSKEFGLVAAQQLLATESLHYGFWEPDETPSIGALPEAQARHTAFLQSHILAVLGDGPALDAGCGTGLIVGDLCQRGYPVDGLVPSAWMAARAREHTAGFDSEIYECRFEDLPVADLPRKYSVVYFSESFQYVNLVRGFEVLTRCLDDGGHAVIFDFFSRDGVEGKSPMGGGHSLRRFYEIAAKSGFEVREDIDVTANLSPNLDLVRDLIRHRLIPFAGTLDSFLSTRYRVSYAFLRLFFRKKLEEFRYKYSDARNGENFRRYKSYRLIVLRKNAA